MNNKRLLVVGYISIVLIGILFISNTYSIFTIGDADPNTNVYTTGSLDITYEVSDGMFKFTDSKPISDSDALYLRPYSIKVTNSGNVDYKFNLKLDDTTAVDVINYKYIKVKVGKHDSMSLDKFSNNVIYKDIVIKANSSVNIDVRIYISDKISNSEVGKNFSAKLSVNGVAVVYDEGDVDNSDLVSSYFLLRDSKVGSYVEFENDNCNNDNCNASNANSSLDNDELGYCFNVNYKYRNSGFRIAYIKDNVVYLISAGGVYCNNGNFDNFRAFRDNLNKIALSYCNSDFIYNGVCDNTTVHGFGVNDYENIVSSNIGNCVNSTDVSCGFSNDLVNIGGYYWIISDNNNQYYWDAFNRKINSTFNYSLGYGLRVVMKLSEDVYILRGNGTSVNPFIVSNKR